MRQSSAAVSQTHAGESVPAQAGPTDVIVVGPGDELLLAIGPAIDQQYRLKSCETLAELSAQVSPNRPAVVIVARDALPGHSDELASALAPYARARAIACAPEASRARWEQARIRGVVSVVLPGENVSTEQYAAAIRETASLSAQAKAAATSSSDGGDGADAGSKRWIVPAAGGAVVLVGAVLAWVFMSDDAAKPAPVGAATSSTVTTPQAAPAPARSITALLSDARLAFGERQYFEPEDASALSLYKRVLAREPDNAEALDGMQRLESVMLSGAQADLAAGRFDEANAAVAALKANWAGGAEIAALEESLQKERQRVLSRRTREALASNDLGGAARALEELESTKPPAALLTQLRRELDTRTRAVEARAAGEAREREAAAAREAASQRAAKEREAAREREAAAARAAQARPTRAATPVETETVAAAPRAPLSLGQLKATRREAPDYPESLERRGVSAVVEFEIAVDERGVVQAVTIVNDTPDDAFDDAVISAMKRWRFTPYVENGNAVPVRARGRINFKPE